MNDSINFTANPNGKLFCTTFIDIRKPGDKYYIGNKVDVTFKNILFGTVVIKTVKHITAMDIGDVLSYANCGHSKPYQMAILSKFYNNCADMPSSTPFTIILLEYTSRNMEVQNNYMQNYWTEIQQNFTTAPQV